jgi:hypothetical protein
MGTQILGGNWSGLLDHLSLICFLVFVVPTVVIVALRLWIATQSVPRLRAQRQWAVLPAQDEQGRSIYYDPDQDTYDPREVHSQLAYRVGHAAAVNRTRMTRPSSKRV